MSAAFRAASSRRTSSRISVVRLPRDPRRADCLDFTHRPRDGARADGYRTREQPVRYVEYAPTSFGRARRLPAATVRVLAFSVSV